MHVGDVLPHSVGLDCQSAVKTAKVFSLTSQSLGLSSSIRRPSAGTCSVSTLLVVEGSSDTEGKKNSHSGRRCVEIRTLRHCLLLCDFPLCALTCVPT